MRRIVDVLFVVVCGVVFFFLVVSLGRTCCLVVCCWLGCRCCGDGGSGSCWLFVSAAHETTFHGVPFRVVFRHGEPGHVAREVIGVSVGSILVVSRC